MKKLGVLLLLSFILNGCSVMHEIIIVNLSQNPVWVEYEIDSQKEGIFTKGEYPYFYPLKTDGDDFEVVNNTPKTVSSDGGNGKISFLLQPMEMGVICNFRKRMIDDPKQPDYTRFNLNEIKMTSADSTILYAQGDQSRHLFSLHRKHSWAVIFR